MTEDSPAGSALPPESGGPGGTGGTGDTTGTGGAGAAGGAGAGRPDPPGRIERPTTGRLVTGVCAGLGNYTRIDPVVIRVGFAVLVLATFGVGTLLYVAGYLLIGEEGGRPSAVENLANRRLAGDAVLTLLGALLGVGVFLNVAGGGLSGDVLVVMTLFGLVLLVAHARGVDLLQTVRTLPERLSGEAPPAGGADAPDRPDRPDRSDPVRAAPGGTAASRHPAGSGHPAASPRPAEMVDLARLEARPGGDHPSYRWDAAATAPVPVGHRSAFTPATLFVALVAAAVLVPVAAPYPPAPATRIVLAAGLGVVAIGLLTGGWFGRGRGLVAVGTILSLGLVSTSVATELPSRGHVGDANWTPVRADRLGRPYRVLAGNGNLDLTALSLAPGQRVQVTAEVSVGEFRVTVPRTARVEVHARSGVGDITVDERLVGGVRRSVSRVLPAEERAGGTGSPGSPGPAGSADGHPPTIVLQLRAGLGDLEVRRA